MDLFTHIVLGASVGGLIASKHIGNKAIFLGAFLGLIPNFDTLIVPFVDSIHGLFIRRGFSHSIFLFLILSPLIALGLRKLFKKTDYTLAKWTRFVFIILLSHSILDIFTVYGTGILEPFYSKRFAISSIAVVDLFFMIPLLITVLLALKVKQLRHKSILSWFGIFLASLYVTFTFLNKLYIQSEFEKKLLQQDIRFQSTEIFPVLGSNFLWNCVAQDRDGFWMCYETNFSKHNFEPQLYMRNDYYIFDFENDDRIQKLKTFSKGYYVCQKQQNGDVIFHDLRFGKMGLTPNAPFVMSFKIRNSEGIINYIENIPIPYTLLLDKYL